MSMFFIMMALNVIFIGTVLYLAQNAVKHLDERLRQRVRVAQDECARLTQEKEAMINEKNELENTASEIFTLYELTSEIVTQPNEEEAFAVFEDKLKENAAFDDCRFIDIASEGRETIPTSPEDFVFPLQGKRRQFGHLVVSGLSDNDKDTVMILGSQFALALRRVKLYREIEELAITDSLTGAHTRRYFLERFEEELNRSRLRKTDLAFLMIDVDLFKGFNDTYGHLAGDQILRSIGAIIRENVREIDIVGRYGGEEFCVVLPDTDYDGATFAAERIRSAVEAATIQAYDATVKVTVSVGMSCFPAHGTMSVELIDKADWALYRAKKNGRNCICVFGQYR